MTLCHRKNQTELALVDLIEIQTNPMRCSLLIALLSSVFSFSLNAQISSRLSETLTVSEAETFHTIRVEFVENVNCYALNHHFKQNRTALEERAKTVITRLKDQAEISQENILQLFEGSLKNEVRNVRPFWIVNLMTLDATSQAINELAQLPEIALIDIEDTKIDWHDEIIRSDAAALRSPNGIEPGLQAINAPAMWALGYTGRGRMLYDYDTGVWPTHPAFADRFLAHRFPMEQCWYGFFSDIPNGNVSDHGTHTLGTMAGLVEDDNDTIGVAFKSYWIANDFVTSTVAALPPLADMMGAFEWALNPDGDINTTHDIPDVINNSWRWRDDPDTVQCAGVVVSLMNAIEAAGVANVFSGGNSGPGNQTVNAPQRINTSEVNTFSVGSVDGNQSFPYPISNFSTRGPTQCDYTGSLALEIHPEVVAPGQNVRSAWGTDDFNTISGTSMAAPHVSGAILLLKEAFPYLSGEDLLWALYETAVDLGDVGEDNVYGRGIIDVHAAFVHLSQSNIPINPNQVAWELAIEIPTATSQYDIMCDGVFVPSFEITNLGDSTITEIDFVYDINGTSALNSNWTGNLAPGNTQVINLLPISTTLVGELGLNIHAAIVGHPDEYDLFNNRLHISGNRRSLENIPFTEDFQYGFDANNWLIQNPDGGTTWETIETSGLQWSSESASVQCYSYSPRDSQKDNLISPVLNLPTTLEPIWLLFDVAYQKRAANPTVDDTLQIQVSTNCGQSWDQVVYNKAGEELASTDTVHLNFLPEFSWEWRRDSVLLDAFSGQEILLNFQTRNRKGNNIYIDNISVFEGNAAPSSIANRQKNKIRVYPNPTNGMIYIESEYELENDINLSIYNALGEQIERRNCIQVENGHRMKINATALTYGLYILSISDQQGIYNTRFIKQ